MLAGKAFGAVALFDRGARWCTCALVQRHRIISPWLSRNGARRLCEVPWKGFRWSDLGQGSAVAWLLSLKLEPAANAC